MKKTLLIVCFAFVTFMINACEPNTTQVSQITNITQTTTGISVQNIFVHVDEAETCMGNQINLTITFLPTNATTQNYTVMLTPPTLISFVGAINTLIDFIGQDASGETISATITVISDDNPNITDTTQVYIHHSSSQICT